MYILASVPSRVEPMVRYTATNLHQQQVYNGTYTPAAVMVRTYYCSTAVKGCPCNCKLVESLILLL